MEPLGQGKLQIHNNYNSNVVKLEMVSKVLHRHYFSLSMILLPREEISPDFSDSGNNLARNN